jgi:L,D-transpeptidase catalytic domain
MCFRPAVALSALLVPTLVSLPALADVRIRIDQTHQRMSVAVDGQPLYDWPVSTGLPGHRTPNGSFRALRMERVYFSRRYDNAPMPHAVFFTSVGHAIHGTHHARQLGRAASHGCVRLSPSHAAALFSIIKAEGPANTRISISGREPLVAARFGRGYGVRSHQPGHEYGRAVSTGMPMPLEPGEGYATRMPVRPSSRDPFYPPYGYGREDDDFE